MVGARRGSALLLLARPARPAGRCCRSPRASPSPRSPAPRRAIKWPNDVLLDGRKVAGILAEGRPQEGWAVLGIGVNVALRVDELPPELHDDRGTLGLTPGRPRAHPRAPAAPRSSARWRSTTSALLEAYRARDALRGHEVAGPAAAGRPPASTATGGWSWSSPAAGAPR